MENIFCCLLLFSYMSCKEEKSLNRTSIINGSLKTRSLVKIRDLFLDWIVIVEKNYAHKDQWWKIR